MNALKIFLAITGILVIVGISITLTARSKEEPKNVFKMNNPYYSKTDTQKLNVSPEEWRKILEPDVFHIAFEKGTEHPFSGTYWDYDGKGTYYCAVCGNKLFDSDAKFASTCGWPSFFQADRKEAVTYREDHSFGMHRVEVNCGRCGAHLGHIFNDGPAPTGQRYCMNSRVLEFEPQNKD